MHYPLKKIFCLFIFLLLFLISANKSTLAKSFLLTTEGFDNNIQDKLNFKGAYYSSYNNYSNNINSNIKFNNTIIFEENFDAVVSKTNLSNSVICFTFSPEIENKGEIGILNLIGTVFKVIVVILFCIFNYKIIKHKLK